jgi:hypothetical protein
MAGSESVAEMRPVEVSVDVTASVKEAKRHVSDKTPIEALISLASLYGPPLPSTGVQNEINLNQILEHERAKGGGLAKRSYSIYGCY